MYVYRNSNTGDCWETPKRSVRLDHLSNWLLIDAPEEAPDPDPEPVPAPSTVTIPMVPSRSTRPLDTEPKAEWVAYAVHCGMAEKDAKALSKASLVKEFGQEEDNDG
ncbi:hypothetical protein [Streptosporangium lutulentum]|uniref:DUF551 domain-containing protein n=1 Tax=Streptosporangium lutulentum TaxID=1461250 RepID=A0ABT9Q935_9ACTN|nr:hypothetical protein [Streptosporangium lutulentum]MDP9843257.1 hypothetical protein [Streptosporangium lutulentum]